MFSFTKLTVFSAMVGISLANFEGFNAARSVVTARAVLPPRALYARENKFTCASATDTVCVDGFGCCPQGAACFQSNGVGLCSVTCEAAQPTCVFNGVTACCPVGDSCGGSLCIPGRAANTGVPSADKNVINQPLITPSHTPAASVSDTTTTTSTTVYATATVYALNPSVSQKNNVVASEVSASTCIPSSCHTVTVYSTYPISSASIVKANSYSYSYGSVAIVNGTAQVTSYQTSTYKLNVTGTATSYKPLYATNAADNLKALTLSGFIGLAAAGLALL